MERPVHETLKASKFAREDAFRNIPEDVITSILDCLPIRDAVRTCILAKNWRFNWTLLTQLLFDEEFSAHLPQPEGEDGDYDGRDISRILLHLKGPITKFVLYIPNYKVLDAKDIHHWVLFLSRKGIQEFTLINNHRSPLKLPTLLFSCLELKHLKLHSCCLPPIPSFGGFPNLLSLDLFECSNYGIIITQSPLLEILRINDHNPFSGNVSENLKMLYVPLGIFRDSLIGFMIFRLLGSCFQKLEELYVDFQNFRFYGKAEARLMPVMTIFPALKTLTLYPIDFSSAIMLYNAFEPIWGSPNLQTLKITASYTDVVPPPVFAFCSSEVSDSRLKQLRLRTVVLESFRGSENEIFLIKCLLDCSPFLKKMVIRVDSSQVFGGENGKLIFAAKLLKLHRASTEAEVDFHGF